MKTSTFLRNAALVLGFVAMTASSEAQTNSSEAQFLAVADVKVEGTLVAEFEETERVDMVSKVATAAAAVVGVEADLQVRSAIERRVLQGTADAKVVRTVLSGAKWTVKLSELGVPVSEVRKGAVVYQVKGTETVVTQQVVVERAFFTDKYSVKLGPVVK